MTNGRHANGSRFGLGAAVRAAGSGFRRACPCARSRSTDFVTESQTETDERVDGAQMEVRFGVGEAVHAAGSGFRRACPCVRLPLSRFEKVPEICFQGLSFIFPSFPAHAHLRISR